MPFSASSQPGVSLRELLPEARFSVAGDVRVVSCTADSRHCRPGDLFVALAGQQSDGHQYASQAVARGAIAVLAQRPLPGLKVPVIVASDSAEAYGRLCHRLAGDASQRLKVVGVTGTNGKTTVSYLVASILEAAGFSAGILGTLGNFDGLDLEPSRFTTPTAPQLASWLARCEANGCTHAVMEVSSHALAQRREAGLQLDVACVTNIRREHLDFHGTPAAYRAAKARILERLRPEGCVVLNADDAGSISLTELVEGAAVTVGIDAPAEITATPLECWPSEQTFLLEVDREAVPVRTTLIGRHNIENCLVAAAVGLAYGLELPEIVRGIESVQRIPGRLERIECGQPFAVYVDYAHTPDALERVLTALREVVAGRLICVFGAGGNRDRQKRPEMGWAVDRCSDWAVVTSDNPRDEDPRQIVGEILKGFRTGHRPRVILDRPQAIAAALEAAQPGDAVVIAGKGHEAFQICGGQVLPLDDRELARTWLYDHYRPQSVPAA